MLSVNMVLLGALTQTGVLPLTAEHVKTAMRRKTARRFWTATSRHSRWALRRLRTPDAACKTVKPIFRADPLGTERADPRGG